MKARKDFKLISIILVITIILSACQKNDVQSALVNDSEQAAAELDYTSEMDKTSIMNIEISADKEEWQNMLDNAKSEEYISADVTINGTTIKNVGIRPKGNSSLSSIALDDTTDRYSFKIKFDEYVDGQKWLGLDKIVLNSNYSDATSMKEYMSYDIMSYIGVDAPLFSYSDISVNGESWGFYLAVEDVDSSYLERVKNGEGELYKPESMEIGNNMQNEKDQQNVAQIKAEPKEINGKNMPGNMSGADNGVALIYSDDNESSYLSIFDNAETKTIEEDHMRVIESIKNLNQGTDIETYVDVDSVLRYLAAHTVVVNLDSYSGSMGHNYYLYENNGQISILPWDYNMSFGGFQSRNSSDVVNFPIDTPVSGISLENRPLISKLLENPEYLERYHQYLKEIVDGYFANGMFEQKVNELNTLISEHIKNDPSAFYTYEEYQAAITELKKLGVLRAESVQGQLDGTIPSTTEGQSAEPDKLKDASDVDMSLLGDNFMGGGAGADQGGFGNRQNDFEMPEGIGADTMRQAVEIIRLSQNGELTDEQLNQLHDLGLTDEQIDKIKQISIGRPQGNTMSEIK